MVKWNGGTPAEDLADWLKEFKAREQARQVAKLLGPDPEVPPDIIVIDEEIEP